MALQQLTLRHFSRHQSEPLEALLNLSGAIAIRFQGATDQNLFELEPGSAPLWDSLHIIATFPIDHDLSLTEQLIQQTFSLSRQQIEHSTLADQDWTNHWQKSAQPMVFGQRLWVIPSCCQPPEPAAVNIHLDPGLAFGTGTHPTTRLCLEWLDQTALNGKHVFDYGCGSGILAIAAQKLGAATVWATDIDPQALEATQKNADNNQIRQNFQIFPVENLPTQTVDIIIANILLKPLIGLRDQLIKHLKPGGKILLSGILDDQKSELIDHYGQHLSLLKVQTNDTWVSVSFSN